MPPIPVHTTSPINSNLPSHAAGASPSTAPSRDAPSTPAENEALPMTTASSQFSHPARPGAPAVPQPTGTVSGTHNNRFNPTHTTSLPSQATRTSNSPPPPQPGAAPSLYTQPAPKTSASQPPRPLDAPQLTSSAALPTPAPSQTIPLPTHHQPPSVYTPPRSIPPSSVTSTYPQPQNLTHPPGYLQDTHASFTDRPAELTQPYGDLTNSSSSRTVGGLSDGDPRLGSSLGADNENQVLNTAFAWAKAAGKKLSETEEQIWKRINREEGR